MDPKFLPKSRTLPNALTTAVIKPEKGEMQGSFIGGSLTSIQNTVGKYFYSTCDVISQVKIITFGPHRF